MIVDYFDELTSQGMQVIPLWENSKQPMCKGWTGEWNHDKSRRVLQVYPSANIGVLLGEIVDVEGDNEQANRIISNLVKDYPHPSYRSYRSVHHLFLSPDPKLRIFKRDSMEFRGHGHQSVLPPSKHQGTRYSWINSIFPVPPMPQELLDFYCKLKNRKKRSKELRSGHKRIWCDNCRNTIMLHEKRLNLEREAFRLLGMNWECQDCRIMDLRPVCRRLKNASKRLQ